MAIRTMSCVVRPDRGRGAYGVAFALAQGTFERGAGPRARRARATRPTASICAGRLTACVRRCATLRRRARRARLEGSRRHCRARTSESPLIGEHGLGAPARGIGERRPGRSTS